MEESWKKAIEKEFKDCLKDFPELDNIGLMIEFCQELSGAEGRCGNQRIVVLFVPPVLQDKPKVLRPIIYHELSHMIDLNDPDRVFNQRADEKSKKLWQMLKKHKALECIVEKKPKDKGGKKWI